MSHSVKFEIAQADGERIRRLVALLRWRGVHVDVSLPPERPSGEPVNLAIRIPYVEPALAHAAVSRLVGAVSPG